MRRKLSIAAGILLLLVGGTWVLQGTGELKGSFMTGQSLWTWVGATCVVVSLPLLTRGLFGARR